MQVMKFCERLETAEQIEGKHQGQQKKPASKKDDRAWKKPKTSDTTKYCHIHGKGSHDSNECKTLKSMAEKSKNGQHSSGSKNKTWSRKADDAKKKTGRDLQSFVKKMVQKELNAVNEQDSGSNKRKSSDDDSSDGSFTDEVNALEETVFDFSELSVDDDEKDNKKDDDACSIST